MASRREFLGLLAGTPLFFREAAHARSTPSTMAEPVHDLEQAFKDPPLSTRPYVLWMWMGSNISRDGITRDLEAMREAGIGGATIFSLADTVIPWAGVIGNSPTPEIVTWTEPWWAMVRHAAGECQRLGLELILHNCAGYESSGGTWITPELSMQEVIWTEHKVAGGQPIVATLARAVVDPHPHSSFPELYIPSLGRIAAPIVEERKSYYRDIAVIALPAEGTPTLDQVLDLSAHMNERGELRWNAPAGEWSLYRFGHTTTGAMIQPAQWDAIGLECDKMSTEAVSFHVQHVLGEIKKHLGELAGPVLTTLYFDSYEAGVPTWTPRMPEQFAARRGYRIEPWLPVLAGRTLGSLGDTERFHADMKRTVEDLYRDCYWATVRPLAHQAGLGFVAEPYSGPWEIAEVAGYLDHANMEFWTNNNRYSPESTQPVIAAAHELGQRIVGAEAFTSRPDYAHWDEHPAWLKPIGDGAFCAGVNRLNLHHFVQQPWDLRYRPGNAMGQWGVHFGRYQTWWEPGKAWILYLWRCQALLQAGVFVPESDPAATKFEVVQGALAIESTHRRHPQGEIFFVANLAHSSGDALCSFPVQGRQPELWDPVTGEMRDLHAFEGGEGLTRFKLTFAELQSFFVIFRKPSAAQRSAAGTDFRDFTTLLEVQGSWQVHFDPAWGGPGVIEFAHLEDWTARAEPGVRYYSGTAVYRKSIRLNALGQEKQTYLELGRVQHIASVAVNGKPLGVLWTAPWRLEIGPALVVGENTIEIAVSNVWANRLIGDEQEPLDFIWHEGDPKIKGGDYMKELPDWFLKKEKRPSAGRYTFTTWNYFTKDSPLVSSGLMGPVRLLVKED